MWSGATTDHEAILYHLNQVAQVNCTPETRLRATARLPSFTSAEETDNKPQYSRELRNSFSFIGISFGFSVQARVQAPGGPLRGVKIPRFSRPSRISTPRTGTQDPHQRPRSPMCPPLGFG